MKTLIWLGRDAIVVEHDSAEVREIIDMAVEGNDPIASFDFEGNVIYVQYSHITKFHDYEP